MSDILRPLDEAGNIGFDEFDQLLLAVPQEAGTVIRSTPDLREKRCSICGKGWELNAEAWDDSMFWSAHEEVVHESCMVRYRSLQDRDDFRRRFIEARLRFRRLEPIFNQYRTRGRWSARPWYQISLLDYPVDFIIGWRKRVVHIEVVPREGQLDWWEKAAQAFVGVDVTKSFSPSRIYVHAWNEEKEKEYLWSLAKAGRLQLDKKRFV